MHKYSTDKDKEKVIYFYLVLVSFLISYLIDSLFIDVQLVWFISLPGISLIFGLVYLIYDHLIWRIIPNKISSIPKLYGHWEGIILSDYKDTNTSISVDIKQTWRSIRILMSTENSRSHSISAYIFSDLNKVLFNYINEPKNDSPTTMNIHKGVCELILDSKNELNGDYYTDRNRKTSGKIELKRKR